MVTDKHEIFFGRQHDLEKVCMMLQRPEYRLISLVGSGGIGKTHLAKQIARLVQADFADGVYFIPLQSLTSTEFIFVLLLETMGQAVQGSSELHMQIQRYLQDKEILLILDNFEHLLAATDEVVSLLEVAPKLKILLTSRETLNVSQEWVWMLTGLGFPASADEENIENYSAVQMFVDSVLHIDPTFDVTTERNHVIRLCQLVEGTPLAIKLASSWIRSLTCKELVEEISRDLDVLSARLRDVPDHHRSIRTVFDHSWTLLTDKEQHTIKYLSVFQGSFSRDAAQDIADISLPTLTTLIEKSLINIDADGRYSMHALLRQYVHEKLEADADQLDDAYHRFAVYYGEFIVKLYPGIINEKQQEVTQIFTAEIDNIRAVWSRIPQVMDVKSLRTIACVTSDLYLFKAYYREGLTLFTEFLAQIDSISPESIDSYALQVETRVYLSWQYVRLGQIQMANTLLEQAQELFNLHNIAPFPALGTDPRMPLGIVRVIQGSYDEAAALGNAIIEDNRKREDWLNEAGGWYVLSSVALSKGDYDYASQAVDSALDIVRQVKDQWFTAYLLNQQGQIAIIRGDYSTAQRYFEESSEIREGFDDPESMIAPLAFLAQIAMLQADFERALSYFQKSQQLSQQLGDKGWWIRTSEGLGNTYIGLENYEAAHRHLVDALLAVLDVELISLTLQVISSVARFMIETGDVEQGLMYASLIFNHPLSENEVCESIEATLMQYQDALLPEQYETAINRGKEMKLEDAVKQIKHTFPYYTWDNTTVVAKTTTAQPLIEPLTERELEVLHLLAQGLSNTEIADHLVVTVGTIKTHNYNIFGKLNVKNRVQAVRRAQEIKLL